MLRFRVGVCGVAVSGSGLRVCGFRIFGFAVVDFVCVLGVRSFTTDVFDEEPIHPPLATLRCAPPSPLGVQAL